MNENGKDPGFGQSILHDCQLIFHTPPYNIGSGVVIHDHPVPQWPNVRHVNKVKQIDVLELLLLATKCYFGTRHTLFQFYYLVHYYLYLNNQRFSH